MKKLVRILAVFLAIGVIAIWLATGANRGWTKTSRVVKTLDEITGIEGITYENKFLPGVDFLGAGLFFATIVTGVSFLFRAKSNSNINQNKP